MSKTPDIDPDIAFNHVRRMLADISPNFCFIVLDEDGDLFYDYTNHRVGKMLMTEAIEDLNSEVDELDWEQLLDEDDEDDERVF
jgi:hypothetical protein